METENKKLAIVYIMLILLRYGRRGEYLTQEKIARILEEERGIKLERKAVGRNIALLRGIFDELGYETESCKSGTRVRKRRDTV